MKQVAIGITAALILLLASCAQSGLGGTAGEEVTAETLRDVLRDGEFSFETIVPVALSIGVDLEDPDVGGMSISTTTAPDEELVVATLLDQDGNVLLRGSVRESTLLEAEVLVPYVDADATLLLDAPGYEEESVTIQDIARYSEVNRSVDLKRKDKTGGDPDDADGDGVPDIYDVAPNDPNVAFYRRIPADKSLTVAFEDNFPELGDGDYNDFVAGYTMEEYRDAKNRLVTVNGTVEAIARAAGYDHEFGIVVTHLRQTGETTVTHYDAAGGVVDSYVDSNLDYTRLVLFGNTKQAFTRPGGVTSDNPRTGECTSVGHTAEFFIDFSGNGQPNPGAETTWNANDPYLLVHDSGYDVHLVGKPALEGSSNPAGTEGFRDDAGYPRALLVPENWHYPEEGVGIETAYPEFVSWRESLGEDRTDWYLYPDMSQVVDW